MSAEHPFVDVEARLLQPAADGVMVTHVAAGSPMAAAGLVPGDLIVRVGDVEAPDRMSFLKAFQPGPDAPAEHAVTVLSADGASRVVAAPVPLRGMSVCAVLARVPAWDIAPDSGDLPDLSAFAEDGEIWLRNSLGGERAGFEILTWKRVGDLLHLDIHFALGGDDGQGGTWEYVTRSRSTHRVERGLPVVATTFWESGALVGDASLVDGVWRGERRMPDGGGTQSIEAPDISPLTTAYTCTLLPLTMPLREGARLTVVSANDGIPVPACRFRFECTGPEKVSVDGRDVDAWCFVQRHYGLDAYGGDERMYVTDDRRLVCVDWGPNYAGCRGELVAPESVLDGVPAGVRLPDGLV